MSEQKTVEPVELSIPVKDVIKRYQIIDAVEIVKCKTAIFFHTTCFWVVSKPTLANNGRGGALYESLLELCDFMDTRDSLPEEEKESMDIIMALYTNILSLPLDVFTDIDFTLEVGKAILDKRTEYYNRVAEQASVEREETAEDEIKNEEFRAMVEFEEELKQEINNRDAN